MLDPSRLVATALHNSSLPSTVGTKLAALLEHYFQDRGQGIVHLCVCDGEGSIRFELTNAGARRPLFNVFSVSKAPLVVLALEVCDRLQLSLDEPVSRFWTAFETGGKSEITIRHLLDHTAGLPNMPDGIEPRAIGDWSYMTRRIGALEPLWKPGTQKGYHAYTFGWLVGETVRRSLGSDSPIDRLISEIVFAPLGIQDFWYGLPDGETGRLVPMDSTLMEGRPRQGLAALAIPEHLAIRADVYGLPAVRRAVFPGAGAIASASAVAAFFGAVAASLGRNDPIGGSLLRQAVSPAAATPDAVNGQTEARALGLYTGTTQDCGEPRPFSFGSRCFGHPGAGGVIGWADPDAGIGVALLRNRLLPGGWRDPGLLPLIQDIASLLHEGAAEMSLLQDHRTCTT
jgi:CubicO group peptidase (beta-lactamase class C family)